MTAQKTDDYYEHPRPELVRQIERQPGNIVLDIGCGSGALAAALAEAGRAHELWGVEVVPEIAARARDNPAFHRFLEGDVEHIVDELPRSHFTHIIAGDVIEHLLDPWTALARIRELLVPGGLIVSTMPNVRNSSTISRLLFGGTFRYEDSGVMDCTHYRFFARKDMRQLFAGAGFVEIRIGPARPKKRLSNRLARLLFGDLAVKVLMIRATNPESTYRAR